jgi:hypothetical protein
MFQVLPRSPSLGELMGGGISQGLQQGLQQQVKSKALASVLGISPDMAEQLGSLPEGVMTQLIKTKTTAQQPQQPKLSPATTQYIKDIDKSSAPAQGVLTAANRLMELSGSTGIKGYTKHLPGPMVPEDIAEFESTINDLLSYYKAMFPRGITQQEFAILKKEALPNPTLSPKANQRRIQRFIDKAQAIIDKQDRLVKIQEELGYVPENIRTVVEKKETETPQEQTKENEALSNLPKASEHEGRIIKNKKTNKRYKAIGGKWQLIRE